GFRDAGNAQRGRSRTEAKSQYITTLIETMHRYASTTREGRELISELEFVWDQIKSNTSSSSSSPVQAMGIPARLQSHANYESIGQRISRADGSGLLRDSRLRVLSPVSQPEGDMGRRNYDAVEEGNEEREE